MNDVTMDIEFLKSRVARLEMHVDNLDDVLQQLTEKVEELYEAKSKRSK